MQYDFLKPLEVKTEKQLEILAEALSNPKIVHLEKTEEEQKAWGIIRNVKKQMSNIDEETVDVINTAMLKDAVYLETVKGEPKMREPNFIVVVCWRKNRFSRRRIENYTTYASEAYYACEEAESAYGYDGYYEFAILNVIKIR